jgi:hypothetical protein
MVVSVSGCSLLITFSFNANVCLYIVSASSYWRAKNGARVMESRLQKQGKYTTRTIEMPQRRRDLQKRKRYVIIRGYSEGNPGKLGLGRQEVRPVDVVSLPGDVHWISSRLRLTRINVFNRNYDPEVCENK